MTEQHPDKSLIDEKLSDLYQQRERAEPSAHLDELIRTAAHDAVKRDNKKQDNYGEKQQWYAVAAMIALVGILLHYLIDESERMLTEPTLSEWQPSPGKAVEQEQPSTLAEAAEDSPPLSSAPPPALMKPAPGQQKKVARKPKPTVPAERRLSQDMQMNAPAETGQRGRIAQPATEKAEAAEAKSQAVQDSTVFTAKDWQEHIRMLLQNRLTVQARAELQALMSRWPEFEVDPDLLEQTGLQPQPVTPPDPGSR